MLLLDFESAICRKEWDSLGSIVKEAELCKKDFLYENLGDMMLRSKAPDKREYAERPSFKWSN
jgi:hypothetical protein